MSTLGGTARVRPHGIWFLAVGYFALYVPYSALTKALTQGALPGFEGEIQGLEILPVTALGSVFGMVVFVWLSGWAKHSRRRRVRGISLLWPGRETFLSACFTAVIIGTTTMSYTFAGVSILFMLLLMRGGVLILSPIVDVVRRRRVNWYSWVGLVLSLGAVAYAVADVAHYDMTLAALITLSLYIVGYIGRFTYMSQHAKRRDDGVNRRYFIEEHMAATPVLLGMLAALAAVGHGEISDSLRYGFTTFLTTKAALPAFGIGLLYEGLFIFGSMVYLDRREFTYCVPVNRGASLLSGVAASFGLMILFDFAAPSTVQLTGVALILTALAALALGPAIGRAPSLRGVWMFVCGGNTARSPMAVAIYDAEISALLDRTSSPRDEIDVRGLSAGVSASSGSPMRTESREALRRLGVPTGDHRSQRLTEAMVHEADLIYCMTNDHRDAVISTFASAALKTHCLDPRGEIEEPAHGVLDDHVRCALRIQVLVRQRIRANDFAVP